MKRKKKINRTTKAYQLRQSRIDRKKALLEWSLNARTAANFCCEVCHQDHHVQSHHLMPKRFAPALMLDPMNALVLCPKHHALGLFAFETNAIWASEWLKSHKPIQWQWVMDRIKEYQYIQDNWTGQ